SFSISSSMSTERLSLLDDDSDGYGEDSVRELTGYRPAKKPYLSPKEIRYEPGQMRKTITEHSIYYPGQETPIRKMSRYASDRLTPVKTRLRQCKALIRPLHSRYYPFCIAFYILLATVVSCYFFGPSASAVSETVLEPVVVSVGDAVSGMKDKMGDAYMGVRDSVGDVYSGVKEKIKDVVVELEKRSMIDEEAEKKKSIEEKEEEERRLTEVIRKELKKISSDMEIFKETQKIYVDWSESINKKFIDLERKIDSDSSSFDNRLKSFETSLHFLKLDIEEKMKSISDKSSSLSSQSLADYVKLEEFRIQMDNMKKEMGQLRNLIPKEPEEKYENLASYINGASIISSATSYSLYSHLYNLFSIDRAPIFLLMERQIFPGDCMPLPATGGSVAIRLSSAGHLSYIEYYHLYWSEAGGIPISAPKEIKIMGCMDDEAAVDCEVISECEYSIENTKERREETKRRRIFGVPIECPVKDEMRGRAIKSIRMDVLSNQGGEHTCLYLTRVLGTGVEAAREDN
ncbi:hypothetical protein PFISCL1PPCAC_10686, partial [Pristionchus fissidentatus]